MHSLSSPVRGRAPEPIGSSRELRIQGLRLQEMESIDKEVGL